MLARLFSLVLLPLAISLGVSASEHGLNHHRRHHGLARRASSAVQIFKRFENARWTFYDVGLGACGQYSHPGDFIVALNTPQFGGGYPGPNCFKSITMNFNGKTTQAVVLDECPGCPYGGLDLSIGLFQFFASESQGVIYGTWHFNDGSGGGSVPPPPPPPPPPVPTKLPDPISIIHTHTKTTTWSPPPSPSEPASPTHSHTVPTSTSTTSTSTQSASTANVSDGMASGLAVPTGTITNSGQPENINAMNNAIINMGGLALAAAH
ncbi:hypothetical protein AX17_005121 [Amanita inopinata Kibby_2008]|nr:hypothetical protein AX17_005121 [Amanita inopinata Kibby_2008]